MRAMRTREHLFIRNLKPDRWPVGDPDNIEQYAEWNDGVRHEKGPYRDIDESLTKAWLIDHRTATDAANAIELTLNKRPAEELYIIESDPDQLRNLATDPAVAEVKKALSDRLNAILDQSQDPRLTDAFDQLPYVATGKARKKD